VRIGTTDTHGLSEARREADALRLRVAKGEDPAAADRAAAAARRVAVAEAERAAVLKAATQVSCRDLLHTYEDVLFSRGRSVRHQREELSQLRLALASVGLLEVGPVDIAPAHVERIVAVCPVGSRARRFGALHRFLSWAFRRQRIEKAPPTTAFARHERPAPPPRRQRVLGTGEVAAIWTATDTLEEPVLRDLVQFLVATPCRESEAATMCWRDVDIDARTWTMPTSKNRLPHRFYLNDRALAVVLARRDACCRAAEPDALVFTAPLSGKAFNSWSSLKRSLDRRLGPSRDGARVQGIVSAPVPGWRLHDLRRSCATVLSDLGHDDALIDLILNHAAARSRGGVTGIYVVSQRWDERCAALTEWSGWIDAALSGVPAVPPVPDGASDASETVPEAGLAPSTVVIPFRPRVVLGAA
jgi:integrase